MTAQELPKNTRHIELWQDGRTSLLGCVNHSDECEESSMYGIEGQQAPELRVPEWLENTDGELRLADITTPLIVLYNFQSWCPGCHSHGFPAIVALKDDLEERGLADQVTFIVVQTVFEGHDENTAEKARASVAQHGLTDIALGHDAGHPPTIMADYRTGGTPWTVLIGPDRRVMFNDFSIDAAQVGSAFAQVLEQLAD